MKGKKKTWITHATLVTEDASRRVLKGHLCIEGSRIIDVTEKLPRRFHPRDVRIDAKGLTILPGFVAAHIHLCQTLFRNMADDLELLDWLSKRIWPMESAHTEKTLHTSALLGIHELLSSGTTAILDMGTVRHTEAIFEAVRESGIRANVGKCLMDHPATTPPNLREPTRDAIVEASLLFEKWNGREEGRIRASFAPRFVISCSEQLLEEVVRLAVASDALIHTHASENLKEIELVRELVGCENVEYLQKMGLTSPRLVLAHCIWLKPVEMDVLAKTDTKVVHCPSSNMKLASGIARVPEMLSRGINVALGPDGASCSNSLNMFQEMRLAALIHKPGNGPKAMRATEVLDMATRGGAQALGWFDEIGSIEVGKCADLVALDLGGPENHVGPCSDDPEAIASAIVYSSSPRHVRMTFVDGRLLFDGSRVRTIRLEPLMVEVEKAQIQLSRAVL